MTEYLAKKILLIGSHGALGRELAGQFIKLNIPFIEAHRATFDIHENLSQLIGNLNLNTNISLVINCIAMTGLDNCCNDKKNAFATNYLFPKKISQICEESGIHMLHFSTDNVFSCDEPGYLNSEIDAPRPNTWYGITKYLAEKTLTPSNQTIARLPMLFGPTNDSQLISKFFQSLASGNMIKVSTDIFSTPTYTPDIASWVIKKIFSGDLCKKRIIHLCGDKPTSLYDFVRDISQQTNFRGRIIPSLSQNFPSLEQKPKYGGLKTIAKCDNIFSYERSVAAFAEFLTKRNQHVNK